MICQNDLMAEGCVYALEAKGMAGSISVIGIDGQRSVAEKIAEGEIDGTVWQNPEMAVDAVKRLTDYLEGDLRSGNIYTEIVPADCRIMCRNIWTRDLPGRNLTLEYKSG